MTLLAALVTALSLILCASVRGYLAAAAAAYRPASAGEAGPGDVSAVTATSAHKRRAVRGGGDCGGVVGGGMMHTYLKQLEPTVEVDRCDKPAAFVEIRYGNVLAFCADGHLIKGRICNSQERAAAVADRLQRWIDCSKRNRQA